MGPAEFDVPERAGQDAYPEQQHRQRPLPLILAIPLVAGLSSLLWLGIGQVAMMLWGLLPMRSGGGS